MKRDVHRVYCKSKEGEENRPTDEWQCSRHLERSRQTDEIAAERSIIECPLGIHDEEEEAADQDDETEKKRARKFSSIFPLLAPAFRYFYPRDFFIPLQFASRKLCIPRARPQILRIVEFSIPLTAFHFPQIQRISQRRERER